MPDVEGCEYNRLGGAGKIPAPGWKKVLEWPKAIKRRFSHEIIRNSFTKRLFTENIYIDTDVVLDFI